MTADLNTKSILNDAMAMLQKIGVSGSSTGAVNSDNQFTNSIFMLAQNGMTAFEGNEQQKASAIANIVEGLLGMLSNISFGEVSKANKENQKNSKEIDNVKQNNDKTVQEVDAKIKQITESIAGSSNEILEAMKEIEKLGGDEGLICAAQAQLNAQLDIIEENKKHRKHGLRCFMYPRKISPRER